MDTLRKLRYSERKQLAETGSLGDLEHESIPPGLLAAVGNVVGRAGNERDAGYDFRQDLKHDCVENFGWGSRTTPEAFAAGPTSLLDFLDFLERPQSCARCNRGRH